MDRLVHEAFRISLDRQQIFKSRFGRKFDRQMFDKRTREEVLTITMRNTLPDEPLHRKVLSRIPIEFINECRKGAVP